MTTKLNTAPMMTGWNRMILSLRRRISNSRVRMFTSTGEILSQKKEWYGTVNTIDGVFTFDCSSAAFTKILHVEPVAVYVDTTFNNQVIACLNSVSLTKITGRAVTGGTSLLAGTGLAKKAIVSVMVKVVGY